MQSGKIPGNAKRVFGGRLFDVYQWKQRAFDGSYEDYEAVKRLDTVFVIPTVGKRIVIVNEEQPRVPLTVGLVSGRIERNEKPLNAAKRELLEELGMISKDWKLLETHPLSTSNKIEWNGFVFVARNSKKVAKPRLEAGERIGARLISLKTLLSLPRQSKRFDPVLAAYLESMKKNRQRLRRFERMLFS